MQLAEVIAALNGLPAAERETVTRDALAATSDMRFVPLPGAQTDAYTSAADVLLYGGSAGCGKSYLTVGLASQEHTRSIIFRRESAQTDGLQEAGRQIIGDSARFNGTDLEWTWPSGRSVKLAGMQLLGDWNKHAGRERDLMAFDEAGEFHREQIASLMAWNRGPEGQRCRIVLASNPPRTTDGAWMVEWFAPWLDKKHINQALPGELRWAVMIKGAPVWVDGPGVQVIDGEQYTALSFTFIPASLKDNPFRDTPEYRARLQSLPEPLRSQLLYGLFDTTSEDDPWQCIPSQWVYDAVARWTSAPPVGVPMCSIGVDVAQGGVDNSVLAPRHDGWFAPLLVVPGEKTPGGTDVAGLITAKRRDNAMIVIDIGGGWGGEAYGHLRANDIEAVPYMGVKPSSRRTADGQLTFGNVRSEAHWRLREALNPDQPGGSRIMLPDDRLLIADLCSPKYEIRSNGIHVEAKDKLIKRLGRSPDRGDAVVMSWFSGAKMSDSWALWPASQGGKRRTPTVHLGHSAARRQR